MNKETQLISLYLLLDKTYRSHLWPFCQRFSNNNHPRFSDVEVLTVYFWGLLTGFKELKHIHLFTCSYLGEWFPQLPSYVSFTRRLNRLSDVFPELIEYLQKEMLAIDTRNQLYLVDSFPVVMANSKRSNQAKVAPDFANKGRCASKNFYFYGIKIHIIALKRKGRLPIPVCIGMSPGSANDLTVLKPMLPYFNDTNLYGDKIYSHLPLMEQLLQLQSLQFLTPVKKKKNQTTDLTMFEKLLSTSVSQIRQPIESLFNWLNEKTGIEQASKVRSWNGLLVHAFGKIALAMYIMAFNM